MVIPNYYKIMNQNFKMIIYSVDTCIEKVDFVENVKTTILFQSILTAWDVSSVRVSSMDGLSSSLLPFFH